MTLDGAASAAPTAAFSFATGALSCDNGVKSVIAVVAAATLGDQTA